MVKDAQSSGCTPPFPTTPPPPPDRAVVVKDAHRGLELISAVQEAVNDPSPGVAALGLRSLSAMCEHDVLDFYLAFKVGMRGARWRASSSDCGATHLLFHGTFCSRS